ncbi:hypothetical protein [Roseovarius sp.]|uniref:hypothetical protein n=1 Tax=Roseovarius sp. TaxID=1486281 RepID=UPI003B592332
MSRAFESVCEMLVANWEGRIDDGRDDIFSLCYLSFDREPEVKGDRIYFTGEAGEFVAYIEKKSEEACHIVLAGDGAEYSQKIFGDMNGKALAFFE